MKLGTGRLCLELVATVHGRLGAAPSDDLGDGAGVATWLDNVGIETAKRPGDEDVSHFVEVREAVCRLVTATARDQAELQGEDVALVNAWARGPAPVPQLRIGEHGLVSDTERPTPTQVLTAVARDAIDLLSTAEAKRLHQCDGNHCGTVFLDTSRGGRRRWCSSDRCGNRARVAAHRDRHSEVEGGTSAGRKCR
ncbi:CGNR zinc finger domain-containing protein [Kutzneria sp. NPDC052558]|uniref:CGNR zinc finger domain-containing protein n=1 Tax=Kutzneria sp. NPDC052558 TaxID=3364121 RepID=UPI0037CA676F